MKTHLILGALSIAVLTASSLAQRNGGFGGAFNWDDPASPPPPNAPAPTPPPPPPANTAKPEVVAKLNALRQLVSVRSSLTSETIQPIATLDAIAEKAQRYRRLVDRTVRQPFLAGVNPSGELIQKIRESRTRWGTLADAIRAGKPPESLAAAAVTALQLNKFTPPAGDPVKMNGALWAAMSNEYFQQLLATENLGADLAKHVRTSPKMRELTESMDRAERQLALAQKAGDASAENWRRAVTWHLHRVWLLGVELQIKLLERELTAGPEAESVEDFLRDMDAARGLRHRGITAAREGAPGPANNAPAVLVHAPAEGTIRATLGENEASVDVAPAAPNRLPQLAAELYHVHYLVRQADDYERDATASERKDIEALKVGPEREARLRELTKSHGDRVVARQRDYEGRRLHVVQEMTQEADRVLSGAR